MRLNRQKRVKIRWLAAPVLVAAAVLASLVPGEASSHREAPLISDDPAADNTDTYAFVSPDKPDTVTLVANWIPLEEPAGGPNFAKFGDDVRYQVKVENNGDAIPDVIYEFRFTTRVANRDTFLYNTGPITSLDDPDWNIRQEYAVAKVKDNKRTVLATGLTTPPVNIGPRSTPDYETLAAAAVHTLDQDGGAKVFAGQRDDPFFVDLGSIFDLGGLRPLNQAHLVKLPQAKGVDGLAGFNTHSIVLQVPVGQLTSDGSVPKDPKDPKSVLGVYSQTQRRRTSVLSSAGAHPRTEGGWVNVSRLGMPLVNEVVVPLGKKDAFNASSPSGDGAFLPLVQDPELAKLVTVLYPGVKVPPAPRQDLVSIFLAGIPDLTQVPGAKPSEMIRLNVSVPPVAPGRASPLGLLGGDNAGFPNGRRLADDVTDISLRAVAGGTPFTPEFNIAPNNALGDGVDANDVAFLPTFPYVGTPHPGYDHGHHGA
jgi:hypothetical protein